MFEMTRQPFHVNFTHLIIFNQGYKEPKSDFFTTVEQESSNDEVHSLDVANFCIILREGLQHSLQTLLALTLGLLESLLVWEGSRDVTLNLSLISHTDEVFDA